MDVMALVQLDLGNFREALAGHRAALAIRRKIQSDLEIAMSLLNIGEAYIADGQYGWAQYYLQKSLDIRVSRLSDHGISDVYMALARAYILQGNRMAARDYLQRSVKEPVNAFGRLWWNLHRSILFLHFNDLAAARFSLNRVRPGIVAAARGTRRVIRAALSQIGRTGRLLKTPMELVKEEPMVSRRRGVERELIAHLSLIAASIGSPSPY